MGGIYTSKRNIPHGKNQIALVKQPAVGGTFVPFGSPSPDGKPAVIDSQTTVSYRSRGRLGQDVELVPTNTREFLAIEQEKGNFIQPKFDKGHEFSTVKVTRDFGFNDGGFIDTFLTGSGSPDRITRVSHPVPGIQYRHNGTFRQVMSDPQPEWFITSDDTASGKAALNGASPTRPEANLATFAGELFAGLPSMIGASLLRDRASVFRGLGSEYLNVTFGWLPFIADLTKMVKACLNASAIIGNFANGSGQMTRRRFSLPDLTYTGYYQGSDVINGSANSLQSYRPDGSIYAAPSGGWAANVSDAVVSVSAMQKRWFSGAFTYYVPEGGHGLFSDLSRFEALANKLLGTRITPEVLWEIAPWSWLVDWIFGIQNNISVATRFDYDGLVLRYGYLMVMDRVNVSSLYNITYQSDKVTFNTKKSSFVRVNYLRKRRIKSTPFGFGITPGSFTARQWSILAALGMTRGPRTLQ